MATGNNNKVLKKRPLPDEAAHNAVWALGNVAGDLPKCQDLVLGNGALAPLLAQLDEHTKFSMLRNATIKFPQGQASTCF